MPAFNKQQIQKGVTLLELLFVLVLITASMIMAYRQYRQYEFKANVKIFNAHINTLKRTLSAYYYKNCREDFSAGFSDTGPTFSKMVSAGVLSTQEAAMLGTKFPFFPSELNITLSLTVKDIPPPAGSHITIPIKKIVGTVRLDNFPGETLTDFPQAYLPLISSPVLKDKGLEWSFSPTQFGRQSGKASALWILDEGQLRLLRDTYVEDSSKTCPYR